MNKDLSPALYEKFCHFLHTKSGIVLGSSKQYLVRSRMVPLLHRHGLADINQLIEKIMRQSDSGLTQSAIEAMTTNETLWFRDKYPFSILKNTILPELAKKQNRLRMWSAASSTGQEAYSIAITIAEFKKSYPSAFQGGIQILGTDLSNTVVAQAKAATYDELSLSRGLDDDVKRKYFEHHDNKTMSVVSAIRKWVDFKQFNLTTSFSSLGKFDVVFCRNVLIYFDSEQKKRILQNISASLQSEGSLVLGASESLGDATSHFKMLTQPSGLYYRKSS